MNFHIIIPARFASERLPGKVLMDIAGKPLIQHVYERALLCGAKNVTIAVDDERVKKVVEAFGASVCMTKVEHSTGTDRLSEVVQKLCLSDDEIIVNIQGDEPLITPFAIKKTVKAMEDHQEAGVTTLCTLIRHSEEIVDPNMVKVVLDKDGFALYFSRAPIPWDRKAIDITKNRYYRHVGLYAYRAKTLRKYNTWERSPLEDIEKLEQLRVLWHGEKIHVSVVEEPLPSGIDTEADLVRVRSAFELL